MDQEKAGVGARSLAELRQALAHTLHSADSIKKSYSALTAAIDRDDKYQAWIELQMQKQNQTDLE